MCAQRHSAPRVHTPDTHRTRTYTGTHIHTTCTRVHHTWENICLCIPQGHMPCAHHPYMHVRTVRAHMVSPAQHRYMCTNAHAMYKPHMCSHMAHICQCTRKATRCTPHTGTHMHVSYTYMSHVNTTQSCTCTCHLHTTIGTPCVPHTCTPHLCTHNYATHTCAHVHTQRTCPHTRHFPLLHTTVQHTHKRHDQEELRSQFTQT